MTFKKQRKQAKKTKKEFSQQLKVERVSMPLMKVSKIKS
jgi:hypothetical protein